MPIVAVTGDACTTTTVALASAWPSTSDALVIEADPSGGDMAAWFDLPASPSLSTVVTRLTDGTWAEIDRHTRLSSTGVRLIPAPPSATEAQQAVAESARLLVPTVAGASSPVAIVDVGRLAVATITNPFVAASAVTVLVHRQATQSPAAAAVRLQRLVEQIEVCQRTQARLVVAVIGARPFDVDEIETFLADAVGDVAIVGLPVDELTASVFAGRTGVSQRRLARLPLSRAASELAGSVERALRDRVGAPRGAGR